VGVEEVILIDEYTDDELHKIAESLNNKFALKIRFPAAYKEAIRRVVASRTFLPTPKGFNCVLPLGSTGRNYWRYIDELQLVKINEIN